MACCITVLVAAVGTLASKWQLLNWRWHVIFLSHHRSLCLCRVLRGNVELCNAELPISGTWRGQCRSIQELRGRRHCHSPAACRVCSCKFWLVFRHSCACARHGGGNVLR